MAIAENVKKVKESLGSGVILVAATKKRSVSEIEEAVDAGVEIIGENYVQDAEPKYEKLKGKVKFHFIGHLQTNKVKKAVEVFDMIETVDSVKLANEIDKQCKAVWKKMPVLMEVNIAEEESKTGCKAEEVDELAEEISKLENVELKGLMTMAPVDNPRPYFKRMKELFDSMKEKYSLEILSMGMSESYKIAIEEGSTMVRVGTGIFGAR